MGRILLISVILNVLWTCSGKVPPNVKTCSRNDPNLNDCMIESIYGLRPYLATGDLGDGFIVPALEPFKYEGFSINPSPSFLVKVDNASFTGVTNFTIEKLRFNYDKLTLDLLLLFPDIKMAAIYDMKARVSILDMTGNGDIKTLLSDTKMRAKIVGSRFERDGGTYIKFDKVSIRIHVGKSKMHLSNLFNGDPTLQAIGNQVINENQDIFFEYIFPVIEKQFSKLFKDVGDAIVEKGTIDELFPES